MNAVQVLVQGTLNADGTLELAEAPSLPAGPVDVLIRVQAATDRETWWESLQRARAELIAQGQTFRSQGEIDADRDQKRNRDELRRTSLRQQSNPGE